MPAWAMEAGVLAPNMSTEPAAGMWTALRVGHGAGLQQTHVLHTGGTPAAGRTATTRGICSAQPGLSDNGGRSP